MADETELHPAVELLLARMESHPEEFVTNEKVYTTNSRIVKMTSLYEDILSRASEREAVLLRAAMNKIQLDLLHNDLMDELFNGEDRRKAEEKAKRYNAELIQKHIRARQYQQQQQQQQQQQAVQRWECVDTRATQTEQIIFRK
jgi:ribosomal protein L17